MKGFSARERNGLIVFGCLVVAFMAIGPLADRLGCTARHAPSETQVVIPPADSMGAGDTVRNHSERKERSRRDTLKKERVRKRSAKAKSAPDDPQRRNYLDEPVNAGR